VHAENRSAWVWGEQRHLPGLVARERCDLLHSLANTGPLRGDAVRVTSIHDLIHRHEPDAHSRAATTFLRFLVPRVARSSARIIVPSRATQADVTALLGVDPGRVDVVPMGAGRVPDDAALDPAEVRARLGIGDGPVVFAWRRTRGHKNVAALLDALAAIPGERRPTLVAVGGGVGDALGKRAARLVVEQSLFVTGHVSSRRWLKGSDSGRSEYLRFAKAELRYRLSCPSIPAHIVN